MVGLYAYLSDGHSHDIEDSVNLKYESHIVNRYFIKKMDEVTPWYISAIQFPTDGKFKFPAVVPLGKENKGL